MAMTAGPGGHRTATETAGGRADPRARRAMIQRTLGVAGLVAIALIHHADASSKYAAADARYIFWLYAALILGCAVGVGLLILRDTRPVWTIAALLAAAPFVSYAINRTIGLPRATDDIGNWLEPLGVASLIVEALVFALSVVQIKRLGRNEA